MNCKTESMFVRNEEDGILGKLDRSPGQEEVYDRVREEVVKKGLKMELDGNFIYTGCYYTIYRGWDGGHKLEINLDRIQPMMVWE